MEPDIELQEVLIPQVNFDDVPASRRDFNILMLESEAGRLDIVQNLIAQGEDVDAEVAGESAASLAFTRGHHDVVMELLKSNAKFPPNFDRNAATDELKEFFDLSNKMHAKVRDVKEKNLEEDEVILQFFEANKSLKYFYDPSDNCSLLKRAILCRKFSLYEFLFSLNIFLAPHESMDDINRNLTDEEREELSNINFRISRNLFTEPMMILMRNCKLGPDTPKGRDAEFMLYIRQAFDSLFKIPGIAIVLKIVAASRNFKIIFDFKRDSVTFLDPKAEPYTTGLMYFNGKIYIGAADLDNAETAHKVVSVIAHELTHYAMLLVYDNWAKPYKENDPITEAIDFENKTRFEQILNECKRLKMNEELVRIVYDGYDDEEMHVAELIVRVPHMLAYYQEDQQTLNERRETFHSLFDFYEQTCVPEMETELPNIEEKFCPIREANKKAKKAETKALEQQRFIMLFAFVITLFIIFGGVWACSLYDPLVSWSELRVSRKDELKSRQVDFQGQNVTIGELVQNEPTFGKLTALQIHEIRHQNSFHISYPVKEKDKVYIERIFTDENERKLYFDDIIRQVKISKLFFLPSGAGDGKSTVFRHFALKLKRMFPKKWIQFVDLKNHVDAYNSIQNKNYRASEVIGNKILKLDQFELALFEELFASGDVILLWDGLDEIAPTFKNVMFGIIEKVLNTQNLQFVSTRPHLSSIFRNKFKVKTYKLIPFSERDRFEFLVKTIALKFNENGDEIFEGLEKYFKEDFDTFKGHVDSRIIRSIAKAQKMFKFIEKADESSEDLYISNPLLIFMISEASCDESFEINESGFNSFSLYEKFISRKRDVTSEKGEVVTHDMNAATHNRSFTEIHQFFALKLITQSVLPSVSNHYHEKVKKILEDVRPDKISRYGILQVSTEDDFNFAHRTYAEFFVASFILERTEINEIDRTKDEDINALLIFSKFWGKPKSIVASFIRDASKFEKYKFFKDNFYFLVFHNLVASNSHVPNLKDYLGKKNKEVILDCRKKIINGTYDDIILWTKSFKDLKKSERFEVIIYDLVKSVYSNDLKNLDVAFKFIHNLPYIWLKAAGYSALYDIMGSNNHLEQFELIVLQEKIENETKMATQERDKLSFETLMKRLKVKNNENLKRFGAQIKKDETQKIIEWSKKYDSYGNSFELDLPDLIKSAYSNDFSIFLNIMKFIRDLPQIAQLAVGYSALYDEMKRNNHLESFQLMMLAYAVKEMMEHPNFPNIPQRYKDKLIFLKNKLDGERNKGIEECGRKIRNGDYKKIISWSEKLILIGGSVELALPDLIKSAYSKNSNNFENVLKFIRNLYTIEQSAVGYSALYDEMKSNNHLERSKLQKLSDKVKETMEFSNYPTRLQSYKDKYEKLKAQLNF